MNNKILLLSICLCFGVISFAIADQEVHKSQMQSVRKSGIHIEYTNFESDYVTFDVKFKSRIIDTFQQKITLEQKRRINEQIILRFLENQFDRIRITKNELIFILPDGKKTKNVPYNRGIYWPKSNLSFEKYITTLRTYLNSRLNKSVKRLLIESFPDRSKYNPNKTDKHDNRGLTPSEIKPLMETCYAFGIHVPALNGTINIEEKKDTYEVNGVEKTIIRYKTKMEINTIAKLIIYHFDVNSNQFVRLVEKELQCGELESGPVFEQKECDGKREYKDREFFDKWFLTISKDFGMKSLHKSQCLFPIEIIFESLKGSTLTSQGKPDIRIDAPVHVLTTEDGDDIITGWAKTRKHSFNIDDPTQHNEYQLISGRAEPRDKGKVHPWTGIFAYGALGIDESGGSFKKIQIGSYMDLGYLANKESLSEIWLDTAVSYGFGDFVQEAITFDIDSMYYSASFNIYKRFYISPLSLYVAPGIGVEYRRTRKRLPEIYEIRLENDYETEKYYESDSWAAKAVINAGYNFSPNTELFFSVAYNKLFDVSGFEKDPNDSHLEDRDMGMVIQCGLAFHTPDFTSLWTDYFDKPKK